MKCILSSCNKGNYICNEGLISIFKLFKFAAKCTKRITIDLIWKIWYPYFLFLFVVSYFSNQGVIQNDSVITETAILIKRFLGTALLQLKSILWEFLCLSKYFADDAKIYKLSAWSAYLQFTSYCIVWRAMI